MIFKQLAVAAILFSKEAKILQTGFYSIPCKFGEDIFINELDVKVYAKT